MVNTLYLKIRMFLKKTKLTLLIVRDLFLLLKNFGTQGFLTCFKKIKEVRPNTILLLEPNYDAHGEVMPGYIHYLLELGYYIDVFMPLNIYISEPLCLYQDNRIRCFCFISHTRLQKELFSLEKMLKQYKKILFTSYRIYFYMKPRMPESLSPSIFDCFPILRKYFDQIVVVEHHFENAELALFERDKIITLADFCKSKPISVNPHFWGAVTITPKNNLNVIFVVMGILTNRRRNFLLLLNAILELHRKQIRGFKIVIIGKVKGYKIPAEIQSYFDIKGRVNFPVLYKTMETVDFFLPLLDPELPEHDRYITTGTSGSFQLIYGFLKPCLIQKKFAIKHGFTEQNSMIYARNMDLSTVMQRAIAMSSEEYSSMQNALKETVNEIENRSFDVIRRVMNENTNI